MVSVARQKEAQRKHEEAMRRFYKSNPNPVCMICGKSINNPTKQQRDKWFERGKIYCSKECSKKAQTIGISIASEKEFKKKFNGTVVCSMCGKIIDKTTNTMRATHRKTGRIYCSKECAGKARGKQARSIWSNPDKKKKFLQTSAYKKAKTFAEQGIHINPLQKKIHEVMGGELEYVVLYGDTYAQIDVAFPKKKIGIEIDEYHHYHSARVSSHDKKRDKALAKLGWKIYRFSDKETVDNIRSIVFK